MANTWYPKFKQALLSGGANTNLSTGTVKALLIDSADEAYNAADEFLSDVTGAGIVGTSAALAGKAFTNGAFTATSPTTFTGVSGDQSEALILFVDTGVAGTSRLICWIDTATGLPFTPNSGNLDVTWPNPIAQL